MARIDRLYAFIIQDGERPDDEGVMAMRVNPPNQEPFWMPLVGADMNRVNDLTEHADNIARVKGKPYKIVEFRKVSEVHRRSGATIAGGRSDGESKETDSKTE